MKRRPAAKSPTILLFGRHAVLAALANPARRVRRLHASDNALRALDIAASRKGLEVRRSDDRGFELLLGRGVVHQGLALEVEALEPIDLVRFLEQNPQARRAVAVDQVTDPRNLGAILRSAAAFGVDLVILPERHAAPMDGVCARAAAGALDIVPVAEVVNLARTLVELRERGFIAVGLDGEADTALDAQPPAEPWVLVLGSEGEGMRRLVRERCDRLASLPIDPRIESLNVSVAAGIALWTLTRSRAD
ncbi:MAG TPA: 23S rRNA (guanosine(2251)-2'-O)-methyltransferase RlmB [Geminicoccus sp.]|uniref:23S rRNA (guanosine(2251)-2'-O)-methyltransferase RlmB n=1 Tax=Geminicoccus sp. TaxID=2024832 RepID=UPI002E2F9A8E|nr:23S rRNA (guanosine(2251)-2'-O)-methyltransferase RlmB [Geminicoccus sp.]HEX2527498.1 23S rRNA (guanosine(2251)-2'-O)-methyltransferase RlmB [Geminicoccus sp.]